MNVIETAEREMSNGNLWRAKEILHKSEIYEKLGNVLLQMSDLAEAGKYLFLSGVRKPEYEKAIKIEGGRARAGRQAAKLLPFVFDPAHNMRKSN